MKAIPKKGAYDAEAEREGVSGGGLGGVEFARKKVIDMEGGAVNVIEVKPESYQKERSKELPRLSQEEALKKGEQNEMEKKVRRERSGTWMEKNAKDGKTGPPMLVKHNQSGEWGGKKKPVDANESPTGNGEGTGRGNAPTALAGRGKTGRWIRENN